MSPSRDQNDIVGRVGRVISTVSSGQVGEVVLAIRGGSEAFLAYPFLVEDTMPTGTQVVVMEYAQPRTLYVSPAQ